MRGPADDVGLVLPVLPLMTRWPQETRWLSLEEAAAIARISRATPDIPPAIALTLAIAYTRRGGSETPDLDLYLAMKPWPREGEPADVMQDRRRRYMAVARRVGVAPIAASAIHPGQAYSMDDGTPLVPKEE